VYVVNVGTKIHRILHPMFSKPGLPNLACETSFSFCPIRKPALYELHRFLQGQLFRRSQQKVNVVWHHHVGMQRKSAGRSVILECIQKEICKLRVAEEHLSLSSG
jgi:endonuclease/exonuclease/phosphatase family metal-dependent hydrolase